MSKSYLQQLLELVFFAQMIYESFMTIYVNDESSKFHFCAFVWTLLYFAISFAYRRIMVFKIVRKTKNNLYYVQLKAQFAFLEWWENANGNFLSFNNENDCQYYIDDLYNDYMLKKSKKKKYSYTKIYTPNI